MIKNIIISRIIARYSVVMALKAAENELRTYARAGKIPVVAGLAAGVILGWFLSGFIGALIGGLLGTLAINSYKRQGYSKPTIK